MKRQVHLSIVDGDTENSSVVDIKDQISTSSSRAAIGIIMKEKDGKHKNGRAVITDANQRNEKMCSGAHKDPSSTKIDHVNACVMSGETSAEQEDTSSITSTYTSSTSSTKSSSTLSDSSKREEDKFGGDIIDSVSENSAQSNKLSPSKSRPLTHGSSVPKRKKKSSKNKLLIQDELVSKAINRNKDPNLNKFNL